MELSFVAGATGYTGRALVDHLARVRAHVRPGSRSAEGLRSALEGREGASLAEFPWRSDAFEEALEGCAFVYACLGTTKKRAKSEPGASYETVDFGLTHWLMEACTRCSSPPRFVYLSSLGADSGRGAYLNVRKRIEAALAESGLPHTIVRPSFIAGDREESRPMERLGARVTDGILGLAGALGARRTAARFRSMRADELARGMIQLALADAAASRSGTYETGAIAQAAARFQSR